MNICSVLFSFFLMFSAKPAEEVYIFSYFTGNGKDGLHLAYSYDGLTWLPLNEGKSFLKPTVGKDMLMRDPCIIQGTDGKFHMVWTTGWWDKEIGYSSSEDLITWTEQKSIPVMQHELEAKNSWAPELFYDTKNKNYIIYWATTIPGRHSEVPTSEREKGLNHRIYYVTTGNFNDFSDTKMFYNPSFSVIDATIIGKDTAFYMIVKNENSNPPEKNLRVTWSRDAAGPYLDSVSAPITGKYWAEGPTTLQVGEYTYVYFDKYRDHKYGAVRSKDMQKWEDVSDLVSFPQGTRHGTAFRIDKKLFKRLSEHKSN